LHTVRPSTLATIAALALVLRVGMVQAQVIVPPHAQNIVLEGSNWAAVIPLLEAAGLHVTAMENPPAALDAAVAETRRVLALQDGPTVLVAHAEAGAVASEVGGDPKVSALVYVAAQAPEAGEDLAVLSARFPLQRDVAQKAYAAPATLDKTSAAAWREKPSFYAVSNEDQAMSPELQRFYAARMKAKTIVLEAVESHPREIAGLILEAAGMKPPACGAEGDDGTAACAAPALPRSLAAGCKCTKGSLEDLTAP
jgi:predicted alpha/beta hydrolase family esterase